MKRRRGVAGRGASQGAAIGFVERGTGRGTQTAGVIESEKRTFSGEPARPLYPLRFSAVSSFSRFPRLLVPPTPNRCNITTSPLPHHRPMPLFPASPPRGLVPLLNSACPWASSAEDLRGLWDCPWTSAVTTRTTTLGGFADDGERHQVSRPGVLLARDSRALVSGPVRSLETGRCFERRRLSAERRSGPHAEPD